MTTQTTTMSREEEQNKFWKFINDKGFWWNQDNNTLGEDEWTIVWKWIVAFCNRKVKKAITSQNAEMRKKIEGMKNPCFSLGRSGYRGYNQALNDLLEQVEGEK